MKTNPTEFPHIDSAEQMAEAALKELKRAVKKHPNWPSDLLHQWAVVQEEVGETQKEVLQFVYETEPEKAADKLDKIHEEAIQSAAMCLRFLAHLEVNCITLPSNPSFKFTKGWDGFTKVIEANDIEKQ